MAEADDAALRAVTNRLDRLAATLAPGADPVLGMFDALGRAGVGVAVVLLVDGARVQGVIGTPERFAATATDAVASALSGSPWSDDVQKEILDPIRVVEDQITSDQHAEQELAERIGVDAAIEDIPTADARSYFQAFVPRSTIDLFDVTVHRDGTVLRVGAMRIARRAISAWWPLAEEQGADVQYRWPSV